MATKYLKSYKVKNHRYWWLVEAHREGGKVLQRKLKYWGKNPPGENYCSCIMPLDDERPLDDLSFVRRTRNGIWHWQKRGDFEFWVRRGEEKWFWKSLFEHGITVDVQGGCWLTRAQNRSEAIKRVKENHALDLLPWLVLKRLAGSL